MLTAYCKKCKEDVAPGEVCPHCGGKLTKAAQRVRWTMLHDPVKDWMCWNAASRLVLPATAGAVLVLLALEALSGGGAAVQKLLQGGLVHVVLALLAVFFLLMWMILLLQGEETLICTLDSRGAHVEQYLEQPTKVQLLARFRQPEEAERVLVGSKDIPWKDIARIQLWPEKLLILLYAPRWWMRVSVPCLPEEWGPALLFMQEKVGKKKAVQMPEAIRHATDYFPQESLPAPETPLFPQEEPLFSPEEPAIFPVEETPSAEELPSPAGDAPLPEDQVAGGEQGSMFG